MIVVQYILVMPDLIEKIGSGAAAAQVSHASMAPITNQLKGSSKKTLEESLDEETRRWIEGTFFKIVLEAPDKQALFDIMERLYADGIKYAPIHESSLGGELTCIGLKPYDKGRIAPYFRNWPLLGSKKRHANGISIFVDEASLKPCDLTYSMIDIDRRIPNMSHRFVLQIDFDEFLRRFNGYYSAWKSFIEGGVKSCGDEYVDGIGIPGLEYIRKNDSRFNRYLLESHYQQLLDSIIPKEGSPKYIITSLEGIFFGPNILSLFGGCSEK